MTIPLIVKDDAPRKKVGLVNGEHVLLNCSNCRKTLVDLWVTRPDATRRDGQPFKWKGKALCCFCGDSSFPVEWQGLYHLGHPAAANPDDPENEHVAVDVVDVVEDEAAGMIVFHTKKHINE